jgi:ATP-dependent Clp protease ATP-binding subunit ClpA
MIAQELEVSLHTAFVEARQKRHEFITVEHLLLALIDNPTASDALRACGAQIEALRLELTRFVEDHTPVVEDGSEAQASLGKRSVALHRRHHFRRIPWHLREGLGIIAPLPEGRC